jgi:hypothetical protein
MERRAGAGPYQHLCDDEASFVDFWTRLREGLHRKTCRRAGPSRLERVGVMLKTICHLLRNEVLLKAASDDTEDFIQTG